MAKAPAKKVAGKTSTPDYFKLPFEVHYSDQIPITMLELKSDIKVKKFEDVKIVHKEQGSSWGTSFLCSQNKGPELYCCIGNLHDEVAPTWLDFLDEETIEMDSGCDYAVVVEDGQISFVEFAEEQEDEKSDEFIDVSAMGLCCSWTFLVYELDEIYPDYLILDAGGARVKVNLDGFVLDDDDNPTDERIFNFEELNSDEFEDYSRQELWEAKAEWVKSIIEEDFPTQKGKLRLSFDTE